jgi:roadblock/LC7 domain-containing protein
VKANILLSLLMVFSLSCQNEGFAPGESVVESGYQLAYGSSTVDRDQLAARILGAAAPKFGEVISRWKRFSGTQYYPTAASIVANPAYCQTTMDSNGIWANSLSPVVSPSTAGQCNTESMNSLSWIYLTSPDRLFNSQNTSFYNGFFSSIKFDTYTSVTTLSSSDADDDGIGVTIAAVVDGSGVVHTLSAYRTGGGIAPSMGWGLLHKVNGLVVRIIDNKTVAGAAAGGWSGRYTSVTIERTGSIVKAYASAWSGVSTGLTPNIPSLIQVDLSDPAEGLQIFMGAQAYGYESISQARATFSALSFSTPVASADPEYIFDLKDNLVYKKKTSTSGYELAAGLKALDMLGYPRRITNVETQGEFMINSSSSFSEL